MPWRGIATTEDVSGDTTAAVNLDDEAGHNYRSAELRTAHHRQHVLGVPGSAHIVPEKR